MRDFSPKDTGAEYESSLSEDDDGLEVQPKAFIPLSCWEPLVGEITEVGVSHYQHQFYNDLVKAGSGKGLCQLKKHGDALGKNSGKGKGYCKNAQGTMLIAPHNDSNRIARFTRASAIRKSSHHLEMALACMVKSFSWSNRVPQAYTFAEGTSGQCDATTHRQGHPRRGQKVADKNKCVEEVGPRE